MAEAVTEDFERTMQNRHVVGGAEVSPSDIGTRSCCPTLSTGERFLPLLARVVSNLPTLTARTLHISVTGWSGVLDATRTESVTGVVDIGLDVLAPNSASISLSVCIVLDTHFSHASYLLILARF